MVTDGPMNNFLESFQLEKKRFMRAPFPSIYAATGMSKQATVYRAIYDPYLL